MLHQLLIVADDLQSILTSARLEFLLRAVRVVVFSENGNFFNYLSSVFEFF
jgi:hypothetical protein